MSQDCIHLFNTALNIAIQAHIKQVDKGGQPYILHPLRLMFQFEDKELQIISLLHDVVEDSNITITDLEINGFPEKLIQAVDALTQRSYEDYDEFILRVSKNKLAIKVKIADLQDNLNLTRLDKLLDKDFERLQKYHRSLFFLKNQVQND